jgi:hypothetical protein
LATVPPSPIVVRVFAVASSVNVAATTNSSGVSLQGVLLAAKQASGNSSAIGNVVAEEFIVQDSLSIRHPWSFPCLDAVSSAEALLFTPQLFAFTLWCIAHLLV